MNEHEKQLNDWLARREREEREERLFEAIKRLLSDPELDEPRCDVCGWRLITPVDVRAGRCAPCVQSTTDTCPICRGHGRVGIALGAKDDEERR